MKNKKGFILPAVIMAFVLLLLIVPAMVRWVQDDTKISTKDQKSSSAFNLAEAAVDRAYWKVKSSTTTFESIRAGTTLAGYRFDTTYYDVPGGSYRISISSGPSADMITVVGEGRDSNKTETRSVKVVYANTSIPGAIISGGMLSATGNSVVHWGPIMAMNDITVSGAALSTHFPRKLSKNVVRPLDTTNDLNPPNTDNLEWWSNYDVPELPQFDFTTMRSSAAATGTLNCQTSGGSVKCCFASSCTYSGAACTNCGVQNLNNDSRINKNYTWYWDNNTSWSGQNGLRGTIIVRGNLGITGSDQYCPNCVMAVPSTAWQEYQKIDTSASNQYPGDTGLKSNAATYTLGSCGSSCEGGATGSDLGVYGFLYVGGDFDRAGDSDIYGALWVVGNVAGAGNATVFYDGSLKLPTLNVVLVKQSWQETSPSSISWP
ncbi:MAG: hypothetical protein HY952_07200 [Elusimicrobia bacterium]|nr:hypothetical protein [Elusimicrobiota bacterium]